MHGKQTQVILAQVLNHCVLRCGTGDGFRAFTNIGPIPAVAGGHMISPAPPIEGRSMEAFQEVRAECS